MFWVATVDDTGIVSTYSMRITYDQCEVCFVMSENGRVLE